MGGVIPGTLPPAVPMQIFMPDTFQNKPFGARIEEIAERMEKAGRLFGVTGLDFKIHCLRMAHVEALREIYWKEKKSA